MISWLFYTPKSSVSRYLTTWTNLLYFSHRRIVIWQKKIKLYKQCLKLSKLYIFQQMHSTLYKNILSKALITVAPEQSLLKVKVPCHIQKSVCNSYIWSKKFFQRALCRLYFPTSFIKKLYAGCISQQVLSKSFMQAVFYKQFYQRALCRLHFTKSFIKELYAGCISQKEIFRKSFILNKNPQEGKDSIVADRRFTIEKELETLNMKLNIPLFLSD